MDTEALKKEMLELLDERGAEYPAEHNVGHLYAAKPDLAKFYKAIDPTNSFNPGIGKMSRSKHIHLVCARPQQKVTHRYVNVAQF